MIAISTVAVPYCVITGGRVRSYYLIVYARRYAYANVTTTERGAHESPHVCATYLPGVWARRSRRCLTHADVNEIDIYRWNTTPAYNVCATCARRCCCATKTVVAARTEDRVRRPWWSVAGMAAWRENTTAAFSPLSSSYLLPLTATAPLARPPNRWLDFAKTGRVFVLIRRPC